MLESYIFVSHSSRYITITCFIALGDARMYSYYKTRTVGSLLLQVGGGYLKDQ